MKPFNGHWYVIVRPLDNDDSESEESRQSKEGSDWPASQDSASQSVDDDGSERMTDDSRQTGQQHRQEVNEAKRAKLREIEVMLDSSVIVTTNEFCCKIKIFF